MAASRTYADACGMAHALDLVGERWAMHVVRELLLGPKRYGDLKADLPGISTNVLAARLAELESRGIVRRRRLDPPAASWVYDLSDWGRALEPVICSLGRWAAASPLHDRTAHLSVTSFVLSLRTNFDPGTAGDLAATVQLQVAADAFVASVRDGVLAVERGVAEGADAGLAGEPSALAAVVYGALPAEQVGVTVSGDAAVAERFSRSFPLPETVQVEPPSRA